MPFNKKNNLTKISYIIFFSLFFLRSICLAENETHQHPTMGIVEGYYVGGGVPLTYNINQLFNNEAYIFQKSTTIPSTGGLIFFKIPFFLGFGLEHYTQIIERVNYPQTKFKLQNTLFNIFQPFTIPYFTGNFGVGFGESTIYCDTSLCGNYTFYSSYITQIFATVGIRLFGFMEIFTGFHYVLALKKGSIHIDQYLEEIDLDYNPSGSLVSAGFIINF